MPETSASAHPGGKRPPADAVRPLLARALRACCWLGLHGYGIVGIEFRAGAAPDEVTVECRACGARTTRRR